MRSADCVLLLAGMLQLPAAIADGVVGKNATDDKTAGIDLGQILEGNRWLLQMPDDSLDEVSSSSAPETRNVELAFSDRHLSFQDACNRYSAPYRLEKEWLELGELMVNRVSCDNEDDLAEKLAGLMKGRVRLERDAKSEQPGMALLHFVTRAGARITAYAHDKAVSGSSVTVYMEVSEQPSLCHRSMLPEQIPCAQFRELAYSVTGELEPITPWYGSLYAIRGFQPRQGYRSVLRLKRYPIREPDIHGPLVINELDMVLETERLPFQEINPESPEWLPER